MVLKSGFHPKIKFYVLKHVRINILYHLNFSSKYGEDTTINLKAKVKVSQNKSNTMILHLVSSSKYPILLHL